MKIAILTLTAVLLFNLAMIANNNAPPLIFRPLSSIENLSGNEVQKIYQDKKGFIWIATRNGLSKYDGYSLRTYKSNLYNPNLLSDNDILSVASDDSNHLWIGALHGLNVMDMTTGEIKQIKRPEFENNAISAICVTSRNEVFLGTDQGLFRYIFETDTFILYNRSNSNGVFQQTTIKSLIEDSKGNIWIGTWNEGLYRYDPATGIFYAYPVINSEKSAHVIFEDSQNRKWIGTWSSGLYLLENEYDTELVSWKVFNHNPNNKNSIIDDRIYSISEDLNTGALWIGTRNGLSLLNRNNSDVFINYYPGHTPNSLPGNEVSSIICDRQNMMWLGMVGGGVRCVITEKPLFSYNDLEIIGDKIPSRSVRSIMVDSDGLMWIGVGSYGMIATDRDAENIYYCSQEESTVYAIMQSQFSGKIWVGSYGCGIYIYDKTRSITEPIENLTPDNTDWLTGWHIYTIKEDSYGNVWVGTRNGLCVYKADGIGMCFDNITFEDSNQMSSFTVTSIEEGVNGEIWVSTNYGILRAERRGRQEYTFTCFSEINGKLNNLNVNCLYRDKKGQIWAGTDGGGLSLFDPSEQKFIPMHTKWNLPGDAVFSITGDRNGNLWLGTNIGLLRLNIVDNLLDKYHLYTTANGLSDDFFYNNAVFVSRYGEMFFGAHNGYNYFFPEQVLMDRITTAPIVITDIQVFNRSIELLDKKTGQRISSEAPLFAQSIRLNHKQNNFSIRFSILDFTNPLQNSYAYRLAGFDAEWVYTDADRRFAYYNNLKPGIYSFHLKAASPHSSWVERPDRLQIYIMPPPWKTWWALLLYSLCMIGLFVFAFYVLQHRLRYRNALHLKELEKEKSEEINNAKLQFFTNITHELFTPLTIISATIEKLKQIAPAYGEHYQGLSTNVNRLIRLLQQILEFRKSETGNLKLKVSKGDLGAFVRNCVDAFRPLMKKKYIHYIITCNPENFPAYFDSDKIDKIIYNLLSNAAKYNKQGGSVWINLYLHENNGSAVLKVRDNGVGISEEAQKTLFKRFYEGEYRKYHTSGTGIGLSLTKDLVELHKGTISVASKPEEGTEFTIIFPVRPEAFADDEVDEEIEIPLSPVTKKDESNEEEQQIYSLLLLEDDEELLDLMKRLLEADYDVFSGTTGQEGLEIIQQDHIDIIVSDVMMPCMNGLDFCKQVKNDFETSHIPVILLTAQNREEDRAAAYNAGADAFISKPFNLTVLHSRIINLIKSRERMMEKFKKQTVFQVSGLNYKSMDEEFLQQAINCVNNHLNDANFDQNCFISEMATSKATLHRKLKSLTGLNCSAFIRNIRLKAACNILNEKKNVRISELAYAVGFNDPKYFSSCFKNEFGLYPSEYVRKGNDRE